jgi:methyl halide transferase
MNPKELNAYFWENRYMEGSTNWDMGTPSPPLIEYCQSLPDKNIRILVLGGGKGHDTAWLHRNGFVNTYHLDYAPAALESLRELYPEVPEDRLIEADFFTLEGSYNLLLEQTFYCAIDPNLRDSYAKQTASLLKQGGTLAGVLFNFPLTEEGPPFGGSEEEYRTRLAPYYDIEVLEPCRNSIPPRAGRELFIVAKRR